MLTAETEKEWWARLGLPIKFPGLAKKKSCLASEYAAGSILDIVSMSLASFRAIAVCHRASHCSHEDASQKWKALFSLSVSIMVTATPCGCKLLHWALGQALGCNHAVNLREGRYAGRKKQEQKEMTLQEPQQDGKWRYTTCPYKKCRIENCWHDTLHETATLNTISHFGGVHDQSSKEEETSESESEYIWMWISCPQTRQLINFWF